MENIGWVEIVFGIVIGAGISAVVNRFLKYGFVIWFLGIVLLALANGLLWGWDEFIKGSLVHWLPLFFVHVVIYGLVDHYKDDKKPSKVFEVKMKVKGRPLVLGNIRRGVSVMASSGSGKTESVIYNFLKHFQKEHFSGVIHDYKDFEITKWPIPCGMGSRPPLRLFLLGPFIIGSIPSHPDTCGMRKVSMRCQGYYWRI